MNEKKIHKADKELKKAYKGKKQCFFEGVAGTPCEGGIINAHTIPKSSLRCIAQDGHVYCYNLDLQNLKRNLGQFTIQKKGINKTSVFYGFCKIHDNALFSKVEDEPFNATAEQCFLLAYRALCLELFRKKNAIESFENILKEEDDQIIQNVLKTQLIGMRFGEKDLYHHKLIYDEIYRKQDFDKVRYLCLEVEGSFPLMVSGAIFPEYSFQNEVLQNIDDLDTSMETLTHTIFCSEGKMYVVFVWTEESNVSCIKFLDSLLTLPRPQIANALIKYFFGVCENIAFSPIWWDTLSQDKKDKCYIQLSGERMSDLGSAYFGNFKIHDIKCSGILQGKFFSSGIQWI